MVVLGDLRVNLAKYARLNDRFVLLKGYGNSRTMYIKSPAGFRAGLLDSLMMRRHPRNYKESQPSGGQLVPRQGR